MDEGKTPFAGWVVLEMMGHQRAVGFCTEVDIFGTKMARLETPAYADPLDQYGEPDEGDGSDPRDLF
jgi:hypothetical protein